jgi:hypothetical protein
LAFSPQVINQLQQLQLNVTWAFLSVGQTMVANVYDPDNKGKRAVPPLLPVTHHHTSASP